MNKENPYNGKSKSLEFPNGIRRKSQGKELAPRSLRKLGKWYLSECTKNQLIKVGVKDEKR